MTIRRHYWSCPSKTDAGGYLVDDAIGWSGSLTRRVEERLCKLAADVSFAKTAEHLADSVPGGALSPETIRRVTHDRGKAMVRWQKEESTSAESFAKAAGDIELTIDAGKVNTREEGWKDLKIAVLSKRETGDPATADQWSSRRLPAPTARLAWATIGPAKTFRKSWRQRVRRLGVRDTKSVHALGDGAAWIWRGLDASLAGCRQTLDIFHAAEHVAATGKALFGEGTAESADFLERGRAALLSGGWRGIQEFIAGELPSAEARGRRRPLEKLLAYFAPHLARLDYPTLLAEGRPIGSGLVEGQAKTLGLRLKLRGARWRKRNAITMANLVCIRHDQQWQNYWTAA